MNRRTFRIAAAVVVVALLGGLALSLRGRSSPIVEQPTPLPSAIPSPPRVAYTPVPEATLSPIVVQRAPARGEELAPTGAIELVFDRPMDQQAVAAAFSLSPAVPGQVQWADARTLRFKPAQPLPRAQLFDVT